MKKGNRYAHQSGIVVWNILGLVDIDAITIIILWVDILVAMVQLSQFNILMTLIKFQVGKPKAAVRGDNLLAIIIDADLCPVLVIIVGDDESRYATPQIDT